MSNRVLVGIVMTCNVSALGCARDNPKPTSTSTSSYSHVATAVATAPSGVAVDLHTAHQAITGAPPAHTGVTEVSGTNVSTADDRDADAEFKSVPGMKIEGDAELEEVKDGVHISVEIENAPAGQKGMHIHQTDDCSDIAKKSMGEHFAPTIPKHGLPEHAEHHLGDLGNITIDKDGKGKLEIDVMGANLKPNDPLSFIGRSIVLHESNDKGTGPSGDSGKPIACAPIRAD